MKRRSKQKNSLFTTTLSQILWYFVFLFTNARRIGILNRVNFEPLEVINVKNAAKALILYSIITFNNTVHLCIGFALFNNSPLTK